MAVMPLPLWAADASSQARSILNQMAKAAEGLEYEGTFVSIRGSDVATLRVIHKGGADGERERLTALNGLPKEVIRKGQEVTCISPGDRSVVVDRSPSHQLLGTTLPQPIEKISEFYSFNVLGGDRVAGRPTWVVEIKPKDADRYGYRLWVDTSSHLLLKSTVIDTNNEILEQILFTAIEVPKEIPESLLRPSISGKGYTWYINEAQPVGGSDPNAKAPWQVRWLPRGFTMQDHQVNKVNKMNANNPKPVSHLLLSDGLATVSVFIEKLEKEHESFTGLSSLGAVNTFSTTAHDHLITVVGEVPKATVQQIAVSVAPPSVGGEPLQSDH